MCNSISLLKLYLEWGVDTPVQETPSNFLSSTPVPNEKEKISAQPESGPAHPPAYQQALHLASQAHNVEELKAALRNFTGCSLSITASSTLFPISPSSPSKPILLFITPPPDDDEDRKGKLLHGETGKVFSLLLESIGYTVNDILAIPLIPWRPPGGRTPSPLEINVCKPFLIRFLEMVRPDYIITLGTLSAQTLLGSSGYTKLQGRWHSFALPDTSFSSELYCLRHPLQIQSSHKIKKEMWNDLKKIVIKIKNIQ